MAAMPTNQLILDGGVLRQKRKAMGFTAASLANTFGFSLRKVRYMEAGQASLAETIHTAQLLGLKPADYLKRVRKPRSDKGKKRKRIVDIHPLLDELYAQREVAADEIAVRRRLDEPSVPWAEVKAALGPCD